MREREIKDSIEKCLNGMPEPWIIGVTDWPIARKQRLGSDTTWVEWKAHGERIARRIKGHFIERGCKEDPDEVKDPKYLANHIYIFRP